MGLGDCCASVTVLLAVPDVAAAQNHPYNRRSPPAQSVSEAVLEITDANFPQQVVDHPGSVLLDVWAAWCGPCRLIAPVIAWAASAYEGRLLVGKAECDANPALVESLGVQGLPTLVLFRDGSEVWRHEGVLTQAQLGAFLDGHL
jgi:thioredoxin 1